MRPQIRSIPLSRIECPQFNWAVRNSSKKVHAVSTPEVEGQHQQESIEPFNRAENISGLSSQEGTHRSDYPCYISTRIEPTLFPHPVNCVCTRGFCPPREDKYRYCKLDMNSQAIGDKMEEIIVDNLPPPLSVPIPKGERVMKKIIASAHMPDDICDPKNEKSCVQCIVKEPHLLRKMMVKQHEDHKQKPTPCAGRKDESNQYEGSKNVSNKGVQGDEIICKWMKDKICTCEKNTTPTCDDCNRCTCTSRKRVPECLTITPKKCTIYKPKERKLGQIDLPCSKTATEHVEENTEGAIEAPADKKRKKKKKKKKKAGKKSSKKSVGKSSKQKKKKKNKKGATTLTVKIDVPNPFEFSGKQLESPSKQFREEIKNNKAKSRCPSNSTKSVKSNQVNSRTNSKNSKAENVKRTAFPQKRLKLPWNFNNQPKTEDPMKSWTGTRYSWSKRQNFAKLAKKFDTNNDNCNSPNHNEKADMNVNPALITNEQNTKSRNKKRQSKNIDNKSPKTPTGKYKSSNEVIQEFFEKNFLGGNMDTSRNTNIDSGERSIIKPPETVVYHMKVEKDIKFTEIFDRLQGERVKGDCLQCVMNGVQQKYFGSTASIKHFCQHEINEEEIPKDVDKINIPVDGEFANEHQIEDNELESPHSEQQPTELIRKLNESFVNKLENGTYYNSTYCLSGTEMFPEIAEVKSPEIREKPPFNVIKQKIHSRSKAMGDLEKFRNRHTSVLKLPLPDIPEYGCVQNFVEDGRQFVQMSRPETSALCNSHTMKIDQQMTTGKNFPPDRTLSQSEPHRSSNDGIPIFNWKSEAHLSDANYH